MAKYEEYIKSLHRTFFSTPESKSNFKYDSKSLVNFLNNKNKELLENYFVKMDSYIESVLKSEDKFKIQRLRHKNNYNAIGIGYAISES